MRHDRYDRCIASFPLAKQMAEAHGMWLSQWSEHHYQLSVPMPGAKRGWIYNLYPKQSGANGRIYVDRVHRGPRLGVPEGWTLCDIVQAAIVERNKLPPPAPTSEPTPEPMAWHTIGRVSVDVQISTGGIQVGKSTWDWAEIDHFRISIGAGASLVDALRDYLETLKPEERDRVRQAVMNDIPW